MSEHFKNVLQERKASYKSLPDSIRSSSSSQEARRKKALEEQKRRRAERFDSSRQLDFFADLNLGPSDDEGEDGEGTGEPLREGVGQFASLLPQASTSTLTTPSISAGNDPEIFGFGAFSSSTGQDEVGRSMPDALPTSFGSAKKRSKNKRKGKASRGQGTQSQAKQSLKPNNKWADKCMYAELLEMTEDMEMSDFVGEGLEDGDGIPKDIETAWVAVTPVPKGKRCLAITHAPSGIAGIVPNTTLRSRVLGKSLMQPFPSPLPSHTVLDCILDENWRMNGILHVLDVLKWKGQDIADCETPFRFWWRDTRMSELPTFPPPNALPQASTSLTSTLSSESPMSGLSTQRYEFQYPSTLVCVPYHLDLSIPALANTLIPLSRSTRQIVIDIPIQSQDQSPSATLSTQMQVEQDVQVKLVRDCADVYSDGMLLYVAQATYEPGTSPLSLWVPLTTYVEREKEDMTSEPGVDGPLDVFERLIKRRLAGPTSMLS